MTNPEKRVIKACAFDLGNTLINDFQVTKEATAELSEWLFEHSIITSKEVFLATYQKINDRTNRPFISHTFAELEFFEKTFQELGITAITPKRALQKYRKIVTVKFLPDSDIRETFQFLKKREIKIALVSNECVDRVNTYMERTGFREFFDAIIVSEGVKIEKPDLRIFQEALKRLDVRAKEMVMLGDNEIADGACKQLGIPFVLITGYRNNAWFWEKGNPQKPDYIMEKITQNAVEELLKHFNSVQEVNM